MKVLKCVKCGMFIVCYLKFRELRIKELLKKRGDSQAEESDEEFPDMDFDKGLKIPGKIWHKLYK